MNPAKTSLGFEVELAAFIEASGKFLTSDQIITGLERALDEALVIAGEQEASRTDRELREMVRDLLGHSVSHYGGPADETHGVGLLHAKARAAIAKLRDEAND